MFSIAFFMNGTYEQLALVIRSGYFNECMPLINNVGDFKLQG